jgi:hypothetical protein
MAAHSRHSVQDSLGTKLEGLGEELTLYEQQYEERKKELSAQLEIALLNSRAVLDDELSARMLGRVSVAPGGRQRTTGQKSRKLASYGLPRSRVVCES